MNFGALMAFDRHMTGGLDRKQRQPLCHVVVKLSGQPRPFIFLLVINRPLKSLFVPP